MITYTTFLLLLVSQYKTLVHRFLLIFNRLWKEFIEFLNDGSEIGGFYKISLKYISIWNLLLKTYILCNNEIIKI